MASTIRTVPCRLRVISAVALVTTLCLTALSPTMAAVAIAPPVSHANGRVLATCGTSASVVWGGSSTITSPNTRWATSVPANTEFIMRIYVRLAAGREADGADVTFSWNAAYFTFVGIAPGAGFTDELYRSIGSGTVRYATGKLTGTVPTGDIHAATVTFRSRYLPVTNTPLTWGAVEISCRGQPVAASKDNGSVTVIAPPPAANTIRGSHAPTPTPAVSRTPTTNPKR